MASFCRTTVLLAFLIIPGSVFHVERASTSTLPRNISGVKNYSRIISFSPSTTETLFALDLGDRVIGVTRFCNYPSGAREKAKVGGYFDPNYEAVAALEPDLVIILPEHETVRDYLAELGFDYITVDNKTIADILSAVETIGKICGVEERARELVRSIDARMEAVRKRTSDMSRPSVLLSIGRTVGSGFLKDVYVAGRNTFYDELIYCAGGRNAYENERTAYPMLSAEGIIHVNPEIIIDLIPGLDGEGPAGYEARKDWESVSVVKAMKDGRLYLLDQDYTVIPGPRFIMFLEDMARIFHPEIKWDGE